YTWGIDATSDGNSILHDWGGSVGVSGANNNDQSRGLVHMAAFAANGQPCTTNGQYWPNDPLFSSSQWGLSQVGAPFAWSAGGSIIKLAIVDSGINGRHEDLAGRVVGEQNYSGDPTPADQEGH